MGKHIDISGVKEIFAKVEKARANIGSMVAQATLFPATEVLRESQQIVPFKTGLLKSSGRITILSQSADRIHVEISYGKEPNVPYALRVHEGIFNFRQVGKRKKSIIEGKGRQRKYLLIPFEKMVPATADKLVRHLQITKIFL